MIQEVVVTRGDRVSLAVAGCALFLAAAPAQASPAVELPASASSAVATAGHTLPPDDAPRAATSLRLTWSGYLQPQYQLDQLSQDELTPDGHPLNQDRFSVRRGRLRGTARGTLSQSHVWQAVLEFDGSTTHGPQASVRRAQVSWQWQPDGDREPQLAVTAGLTGIPFGAELRTAPDRLPFLERSAGSQAWFTGPVDTGARLHGALGWFRFDLAVMGGTPLDDRAATLAEDAVAAPDVVGRIGLEAQISSGWQLTAGLSALTGKGFSPGTPASKAQVAWQDFNDNGLLDSGELVALPALAQRPSETFERWAVGADLTAILQSSAGVTLISAEAALGSNMDRGLFVADPIGSGLDQRSALAVVSIVQRLPRWASFGVRAALYRPDLDWLDPRRGELWPVDQRFDVLAPQLTWHFNADAQLQAELQLIDDRLGRDLAGQPVDAANNRLSLRGQLRF